MSNEIRELAVRLAVESGIADVYRDGLVPLVSDVDISNEVEALVRSAMREGMMRAAEIVDTREVACNWNTREALSKIIRAEAEKLNTGG